MKKQFTTYEIAIELKKLGFNEICLKYYDINYQLSDSICDKYVGSIKNDRYSTYHVCTAPLWSQIIDWLREEHKLHVEIQCPDDDYGYYSWCIHELHKFGSVADGFTNDYYISREQAILKAIELCWNV